jgi:N-acylneuraminate cytidylyltransferase
MKTVCVIPARGGSKGVKNKNLREVGGQPLISYAILDALRVPQIDEVYVSTDSRDIIKVAKHYGAEAPFLRPPRYSKDNSPDIAWVRHFLVWHRLVYQDFPQFIVHLRATTPIRDIGVLDNAITTLKSNPQATSLRSVELFAESPYKWVKIDDRGYFQPLLGQDTESHLKPRQKYPNVYRPNGYIDIYRTTTVCNKSLCGSKTLAYITPFSMEVDNEESLDWIDAMLKKT